MEIQDDPLLRYYAEKNVEVEFEVEFEELDVNNITNNIGHW